MMAMMSVLVRSGGQPLTALEVRQRLPRMFRNIHVRSMQRDLIAMMRWGAPIRVNTQRKPYEWRYIGHVCPTCWRDPQGR